MVSLKNVPLITVFTATYNRGHLIQRIYQSLLRQKEFNFEWLVIDDGSQDQTEDLFNDWTSRDNPFEIRYYKQENLGLIRTLNWGVELARGEYFAKIDSDDYVVDDYMNAKSLQHLSQKAEGVEVVLFTENGKGGKGFLTKSLVTDFQNEYPALRIKPNPDCHDRLIVLDYGEETELVYHCGASSKDAGKKLCAINQITETSIIHPVIDRLLLLPDKPI